jgi:type IV secretory pathway protease TraF
VALMRGLARYRKTLAAVLLGLAEVAAYVAADPRDLPSWVVTAALAVNALAVYGVRNAQPVTRDDLQRRVDYLARPPRQHVRREDRGP